MLDDLLEKATEQPADACLGKNPRDHLEALLRGAHGGRHCRLGRGLQHIRVQTLRRLRHASTRGTNVVDVGENRHRLLTDEGAAELLDHARLRHANQTTSLDVHQVVGIHRTLDIGRARVDRLRQAVERVADNVRFDELQVHDEIRNRRTDDHVGLGVGADHRELYIVHDLVVQHVGRLADRANATQFGDPVTILVDADVALDILISTHRRVGIIACPAQIVTQCRIANLRLCVQLKRRRGIAVLLDVLAVVAHLDELGHRLQRAVSYILRIVQITRVSGDQELFRGHALDELALLATDFSADKNVEKRGRQPGHRVGLAFPSLDGLQGGDRAVLLQKVNLRLIYLFKNVFFDGIGRCRVPLEHTDLAFQGILDRRVHDREARIVHVEHVGHVVGRLLGHRHVFGTPRGELDRLFGGREHAQEARQHGEDHIADLAHHDLAAALLLVAERLRVIVFLRLLAQRRDLVVDVVGGVRDRSFHSALKLLLGHAFGGFRRLLEAHLLQFHFLEVVRH